MPEQKNKKIYAKNVYFNKPNHDKVPDWLLMNINADVNALLDFIQECPKTASGRVHFVLKENTTKDGKQFIGMEWDEKTHNYYANRDGGAVQGTRGGARRSNALPDDDLGF